MNAKKHKSKHRAKVNPASPQKVEKPEEIHAHDEKLMTKNPEPLKDEENVKNIEEVKHLKTTVLKDEEEVQNIVQVTETVEDKSSVDTCPVKPKRSKGKKKKPNALEGAQDDKVDISKEGEILKDNEAIPEVNPNDTIVQKPSTVQPNAPKKKHKGKKHLEPSGEVLKECKSDIVEVATEQSPVLETKDVENKTENEIESNITSKKNKKKKRRQESEKSEKSDEKLSSTTVVSEIIDKVNDSIIMEKETLKDAKEILKGDQSVCEKSGINISKEDQNNQNIVNVTDSVSHKKKKKAKKHPQNIKIEPNKQPECTDMSITVDPKSKAKTSDNIKMIQQNVQSLNEEQLFTEQSYDVSELKPELKISTQSEFICSQNIPQSTDVQSDEMLFSKPDSQILEENTIKDTDTVSPIVFGKDSKEQEDSEEFESINKHIKSEKLSATKVENKAAKEKQEESAIMHEHLEQKSDNFNTRPESNTQSQISSDTITTHDDNSLKSYKTQTEEIPIPDKSRENTDDLLKVVTAENDKVISSNECSPDCTPDFIQMPRSNSQQILDENNNNDMVIHEITSSDDLKLGLPILTSDLIQGSGETPVSTPKVMPDSSISVTEIESTHSKVREKTDLKSKMIEVNQDLEELKMSLEKSLAELNAIEKSEEKFENKSNESLEKEKKDDTKFEENIPKEDKTYKPLADRLNEIENKFTPEDIKTPKNTLPDQPTDTLVHNIPVCPSRKDRKGKGKSKKKGKIESEASTTQTTSVASETKNTDSKNENNNETKEKSKASEEKGKQQASNVNESEQTVSPQLYFEPIENFEDALTSSVEDVDVNKTFEIIAKELNNDTKITEEQKESFLNKPEINITPPVEDTEKDKEQKNVNPLSQPKNLLGHPNIPVQSNKTDYKKEKNKTPNSKQAKVKIKDSIEIDLNKMSIKRSKQSQTDIKPKLNDKNGTESFSYVTNEKEEYVYKYSFRNVFLASVCHICRKELKQIRMNCKFCNLVFYCSQKHKDEDWPRHQSLCFAVSTIVHLKDQKHIYANAKYVSGDNYRLIRMQMILSCEKVLKRKLIPWEQEALLYPRICADIRCREWKQSKLSDCEGCGQVSYCTEHPEHLPSSHQRWCKSFALYQKLVLYQQANGRLEPKLPSKVMLETFVMPAKMNEVLASIYEEKIDMSDIQYAALTQLATAPLTTAFCHQIYRQAFKCSNGITKRSTFTIHAVGAELQFEADSLNKWEVFLLHLKPEVKDLRVALIGPDLNPSDLPLDLLGKIKLCEHCRMNKRRVQFSFQDKKSYHEFWSSDDFTVPDIVCAFNPSIQRVSIYNGGESWPLTINCIMKQKIPLLITSHTIDELNRDLECIKNYAEVNYKVISEPKHNPFASVRPDRNFITDDETPLLFKNYCFSVLCGV